VIKITSECSFVKPRKVLKEARLKMKLTQKKLREILLEHGINISVSFISKVEQGKRDPSIKVALIWVKILKKNMEECFPLEPLEVNIKK